MTDHAGVVLPCVEHAKNADETVVLLATVFDLAVNDGGSLLDHPEEKQVVSSHGATVASPG